MSPTGGAVELPFRAKAIVVAAAGRAAFCWAVAAAAVATPVWLGWSSRSVVVGAVVLGSTLVLVSASVFVFPITRVGDWAARRLTAGVAPRRLANVAAELAIAIGVPEGEVAVIDSDVPNVGAFPTRAGSLVVATSGAVSLLDRDELEAMVASQLVVAANRWVRWASAAQLVQGPRFALLFGCVFINPLLMPVAFLAFFGSRYADGARDLVADAAAVAATRNPEPLVRAFRSLAAYSGSSASMRSGLPGLFVDQFWVLSTRRTTRTTVGGRTWTTADEVAAEMTVRADRAAAAARGDWTAFSSTRSWRRALRNLDRRGPRSG